MIEMKNFFIQSRRENITWRGNSGGSDKGNDLR